MKSKVVMVTLALLTGAAHYSLADEDFDPEPIIESRQAALRDIGGAFKGISDELKKPQPALATIRQYARQITELWQPHASWFPPGTGPDTEIEMTAKQEIWEAPAKFSAAQRAMTEQTAKLVQVSAGTDVSAIRAQWQAVGKTCKGCHDQYREDD